MAHHQREALSLARHQQRNRPTCRPGRRTGATPPPSQAWARVRAAPSTAETAAPCHRGSRHRRAPDRRATGRLPGPRSDRLRGDLPSTGSEDSTPPSASASGSRRRLPTRRPQPAWQRPRTPVVAKQEAGTRLLARPPQWLAPPWHRRSRIAPSRYRGHASGDPSPDSAGSALRMTTLTAAARRRAGG